MRLTSGERLNQDCVNLFGNILFLNVLRSNFTTLPVFSTLTFSYTFTLTHLFTPTFKKGWDAAPPRIVSVLLHCLFKSHTVKRGVCVYERETELEERVIRVGRVISNYHPSDYVSQWDYFCLLGLGSGKTETSTVKKKNLQSRLNFKEGKTSF